MDKEKRSTDSTAPGDRKRRDDALAHPKKFFPRREDVLDDDTLSAEEKRTMLDNWKVQLEGRGGAEPGDQTIGAEGDKVADAAGGEAQGKVEGDKGG